MEPSRSRKQRTTTPSTYFRAWINVPWTIHFGNSLLFLFMQNLLHSLLGTRFFLFVIPLFSSHSVPLSLPSIVRIFNRDRKSSKFRLRQRINNFSIKLMRRESRHKLFCSRFLFFFFFRIKISRIELKGNLK